MVSLFQNTTVMSVTVKFEFLALRHEGEMYKTLLSDYDTRQSELVLENAELRKVLQQMKKDMVSILSSRKAALKSDKHDQSCSQVGNVYILLF